MLTNRTGRELDKFLLLEHEEEEMYDEYSERLHGKGDPR